MHYFLINYSYATIGGHKKYKEKYAINTRHQFSTKTWNKQTVIFLFDVALFLFYFNTLPFEPAANKGLSLLAFVAILWLTEAVSVTITALFVPILSILLGLANSREALVAFADPTIFLFFLVVLPLLLH